MAYFLNLFSPETYQAFGRSDRSISGFRKTQQGLAGKVVRGDKLICYMTGLSRWIGVLEVQEGWFEDDAPVFLPEEDPFVIRFKVKPLVWVEPEHAVPIHDSEVWNTLSFTRHHDKATSNWTGKIRSSLGQLEEQDGRFLEQLLLKQRESTAKEYPLEERDRRKLITHQVRRLDKVITVSVPEDFEPMTPTTDPSLPEIRESIKIQALLATIGAQMGLTLWLPKSDRGAVYQEWNNQNRPVLDILPLNYDETTLKTIEQIDVLWLKGRSIVRAFEVEHTTSVYSGILRMADLLALQPNMDIRLHIAAPVERRDKVFQEIRRPVFSLLEKGPLSANCTFLSYDSIRELAGLKHLAHLSDSVLDEYTEEAE